MKIILAKLINRRCSSANGSITSSVGAVTSLILMAAFGLVGVHSASAANSTLSMTVSQATASLDVMPRDINGVFAASNTDIAFTVATTNYSGYTVGITASSNGANAANLTHSIT